MARTMGCNSSSSSNSNSNVLDAGRTSNNNRMLNAVRDQEKCVHQQNMLLNTINVSWFELDCKSRVSALAFLLVEAGRSEPRSF